MTHEQSMVLKQLNCHK